MEKVKINLEDLISEGKDLHSSVSYVPAPSNVIRFYSVYKFEDYQKFEIWKNKCLRFLSLEFEGDRCIKDFEEIIKTMDCKNYPTSMNKLIGILESCTYISRIGNKNTQVPDKAPSHVININNSQNQSQYQEMAVDVFVEAIKDELTGHQLKEIQNISKNNSVEEAKPKIIEKLKSFGGDVLSNILANILTNPTIWGHF